ncbi:MAG TPA: hypothetical protein VN214_09015 [Pseudomonas sp.]|nr:hypothetical protein [Pseudomonas sp.]
MNISFADALFVIVGLTIFGGALIVFGIALYLGYTKGNVISDHFKNSSSVITIPARMDKGLRGKTRLVYSVSTVVTFPRFFLKRGLVSAEDIDKFPNDLRCKLVVLQWSLLTLLTGSIVLGLIAVSGAV